MKSQEREARERLTQAWDELLSLVREIARRIEERVRSVMDGQGATGSEVSRDTRPGSDDQVAGS